MADAWSLLTCSIGSSASTARAGVVRAELGMTLDQLLHITVPQGWFVPVLPGTKFVTLGGAVANDVHGKNHEKAGTFGAHVLSLGLARSSGDVLTLSREQHAETFAATIGGLGLTGMILWVELQLVPIRSSFMDTQTFPIADLDGFFRLAQESGDWPYTVAWVDCLARGRHTGRGYFIRGRHSEAGGLRVHRAAPLSIPMDAPASLFNSYTIGLTNRLYRRRPWGYGGKLMHYDPFFFPLDGIGQWNRLYGKRGFFQHQSVVPTPSAVETVRKLLELTAKYGEGSFFVVLKLFGNQDHRACCRFLCRGLLLRSTLPITARISEASESHDGCGPGRRRTDLSRQGRHHVGCGVSCGVRKLAQGQGATGPGDHVRLLASRSWQRSMSTNQRILVLGAASAIAQAYARRRATDNSFVLAGRNEERLVAIAADLITRGAVSAEPFSVDLAKIDCIEGAVRSIETRFGAFDEVVVAYGVLGNQIKSEQDLSAARLALDTNFTSAVLWTMALLKVRLSSAPLTIVAIGSVAGDRGRATNFVYGAAKAGFDRFFEGLAQKYDGFSGAGDHREAGAGEYAVDRGDRKARTALWATPDKIAADMQRAVAKGRRVIYTPWFWQPIMVIIRHLPWFIFKRLKGVNSWRRLL